MNPLQADNTDEFVTKEELEAIVSGLTAVIGRLTVTVSAYGLMLHKLGLTNPDLWKECLDSQQDSEWQQRLQSSIEKLRQNSSIEDVLKAFQGPMQ